MNNNEIEKRMQEIEAKNSISKFEILHVSEIMEMDLGEVEWLIKSLIPLECITILSGPPGNYKTWLFIQMAINIAQGTKFLDKFDTSQLSILIINEEDHLRIIKKRLKLLNSKKEFPIYFLSQKNFSVSKGESVKEIIEICKQKDIKVIFIDSLIRISDSEENSSNEMSKVFKKLREFCQAGITVVVTHHERKEGHAKSKAGSRLRGSSDILANLDSHLAVKKYSKDKNRLRFEQSKLRLEQEIEPFDILIVKDNDTLKFEYVGTIIDDNIQKDNEIREIITNILTENINGLTKKKITEEVLKLVQVGIRKPGLIIEEMIKEDLIVVRSGNKNSKLCFLKGATNNQLNV